MNEYKTSQLRGRV